MKKKQLYEAPSVETYDLMPENQILEGSFSSKGTELMTEDEEEDFV